MRVSVDGLDDSGESETSKDDVSLNGINILLDIVVWEWLILRNACINVVLGKLKRFVNPLLNIDGAVLS